MTEEKTRIHTRISSDTQRKMEIAFPNANCRSRNEFVEEAIRFYSDHIISQEVTDFLAPALVSALRATIQGERSTKQRRNPQIFHDAGNGNRRSKNRTWARSSAGRAAKTASPG